MGNGQELGVYLVLARNRTTPVTIVAASHASVAAGVYLRTCCVDGVAASAANIGPVVVARLPAGSLLSTDMSMLGWLIVLAQSPAELTLVTFEDGLPSVDR
jgi:hypothetical protein